MFFAISPAGLVDGTGIPSIVTVQAGSAVDLQREVNEVLTALSVSAPDDFLLSCEFAAAGNGNQWACVLSHSVGWEASGVEGRLPPQLSSFGAAAPAGFRGQVLVAQSGSAAEAASALRATVTAAKPVTSPGTSQTAVELVGSANGAQWLAATLLVAFETP